MLATLNNPSPIVSMRLSIEQRLASELSVREQQVQATVSLLDDGATVPFIARYRKEKTGGLDDVQLRKLAERLTYLRELDERREAIKNAISDQGKMTDALSDQLDSAQSKQRLEDLYAPYRARRRTKAQVAREAGLEPLADLLLSTPERDPNTEAAAFIRPAFAVDGNDNPGVPDVDAALDGAARILIERIAENADLIEQLRRAFRERGLLLSRVVAGKEQDGAKYADYFNFQEKIAKVASHRAMAMLRGRREQILRLTLALPADLDDQADAAPSSRSAWCEQRIARSVGIADQGRPADAWLMDVVRRTWQQKMSAHIATELIGGLRERAEADAIQVFGRNLKNLLLAAPAGQRATIGLDPGLRTGVKVAVVDGTGKVLVTDTIYPHPPRKDTVGSMAKLAGLAKTHGIELIAVGNGTGSRETGKMVNKLIARHPELKLTRVSVSEAGASVYSASKAGAEELPELDVSLRGAVSIARRLQDPLAELVKIEPKAIGVGQYQHDVSDARLARTLDDVVEDCVNAVGVDVNSASAALLARIAGLNAGQAENIVRHRNEHGTFSNRTELLAVDRLGKAAFEQAAGFLRINDGDNPLDRSAVHPEAYPLVNRMLADIGAQPDEVFARPELTKNLSPEKYVDDQFGLPTVLDIIGEIEKPGRDPRPGFKAAAFKEGVEKIGHLKPDMILEGVVTNVAAFGAFVDVGVHQDGLVHISALADKYVSDPHQVVSAGDLVTVRVIEVDVDRKRIGLSMRLSAAAGSAPAPAGQQADGEHQRRKRRRRPRRSDGAGAARPAAGATQENTEGATTAANPASQPGQQKPAPGKRKNTRRRKPRPDNERAGGRAKPDKPLGAMALAMAAAGAAKQKK